MSETNSKPGTTARPWESDGRPLVLKVLPRIVHLIIQQDRTLAPALFFARRSSYALRSERLLQIVDLDELGLGPEVRLPAEVILVAQSGHRVAGASAGAEAELRTWQLAASALAILRLREAHAANRLTTPMVHARIETIGRDTFADIEAVLERELHLFDEDDLVNIYAEFITLHAELQTFLSNALDTYFPALRGRQSEIAELVASDLAWEEVLEATRPEEAALPQSARPTADDVKAADAEILAPAIPGSRPNSKKFSDLMGRGAAVDGGNAVGAAVVYRRACLVAPDKQRLEQAEVKTGEVIGGLVSRLQLALEFDSARAETWHQALLDVVNLSSPTFWNTNRRLLYDLQKLCVDNERESSTIDLFGYLRTLGRRPLKKPLPNQREVLMCKHLQRASSRVAKARITAEQREILSSLLREANASVEGQLRGRLRKRIARSLNERGLMPENIPERVARDKLIEELLDGVVRRGHLSMGDVRDAISRSHLNLADLTVREILVGDALLRADRRLNRHLDGVYRRGEFYLRGLQRLTSLGFGWPQGRFVFQHIVVPFGGAFVILEGLGHLQHTLGGGSPFWEGSTAVPESWLSWLPFPESWQPGSVGQGVEFANIIPTILIVGLFILALIQAPAFRSVVGNLCRGGGRVLKHLLIDLPSWIFSFEWARVILLSRLAKVFRRYLLAPLIPSLVLYGIATIFVNFNAFAAWGTFMVIFTALNILLNSSFGRRLEAGVWGWAAGAWFHLGTQIFRSLFDFIMALFRQMIEVTERVLYAIDEWLLFKSGENKVTFWFKGIFGSIWSVIAYVIRFCLTLLVEPQVNPIKHFPVVTVSHKLLLPTQPLLAMWLGPGGLHFMGNASAQAVAGAIVFLTPGIVGFLVWELRSNWNLYAAKEEVVLKPAVVGSHGESLARLLKPGFHSGAIGKVYARMRRSERRADSPKRHRALAKYHQKLHHIEVDVGKFVRRELFSLLRSAEQLDGLRLEVTDIVLLPTTIHLRIVAAGAGAAEGCEPLHLLFQNQRDWLVAKVVSPGWIGELAPDQQAVMATALAGFYKSSGVDLVDELVRHSLPLPGIIYRLRRSEIDVWAGESREKPVHYRLRSWGVIRPHPTALAKSLGFPSVTPKQLLFRERDLPWDDWVNYWENSPAEAQPGGVLDEARRFFLVSVSR